MAGALNGKGTLSGSDFKFVGEFKNGKYHGSGSLVNSFEEFHGTWVNGKKEGRFKVVNGYNVASFKIFKNDKCESTI